MRRLYISSGLEECRILRQTGIIPSEPTPVYMFRWEDLIGWQREGVCVVFVGNYNKHPEIEKMVDLVLKNGYLYFIQGTETPSGMEKYIQ